MNEPNKGHVHFSLDGGKYDYPKYSGANGDLAVQLGVDGMYSPATEPSITYSGLPAGEHTLEVDLVNNDHSETGTTASTTFTVEERATRLVLDAALGASPPGAAATTTSSSRRARLRVRRGLRGEGRRAP